MSMRRAEEGAQGRSALLRFELPCRDVEHFRLGVVVPSKYVTRARRPETQAPSREGLPRELPIPVPPSPPEVVVVVVGPVVVVVDAAVRPVFLDRSARPALRPPLARRRNAELTKTRSGNSPNPPIEGSRRLPDRGRFHLGNSVIVRTAYSKTYSIKAGLDRGRLIGREEVLRAGVAVGLPGARGVPCREWKRTLGSRRDG